MEAATVCLRELSLAEGSKSNRQSNVSSFSVFCDLFGLQSMPASPSTLVQYVVYSTVIVGRAVSTTRNHLSSIRRDHIISGYQMFTPSVYLPLKDALRGAERFQSRPVRKKHPLHPWLVSRLCSTVRVGSPWRSLYLFLFCTFARLASVIPTGRKQVFSVSSHLTWTDVTFKDDGVLVRLRRLRLFNVVRGV